MKIMASLHTRVACPAGCGHTCCVSISCNVRAHTKDKGERRAHYDRRANSAATRKKKREPYDRILTFARTELARISG